MTEQIKPDPYHGGCPSRNLLEVVGDKWSLLIIPLLLDGPKRNGELLRRIDGLSQKMLTQTLKELEKYGIVSRKDYHEVPPRVDYSLTSLGKSLSGLLVQVDDWVVDNFDDMMTASQDFV